MAVTLSTTNATLLGQRDLELLLKPVQGPCISIHLAGDQRPAQADQNRIRFKNAVREAADSLGKHVDPGQRDELLAPLYELLDDEAFFSGHEPGVVVYRSPDAFLARRVAQLMPQFTVVADSFHVKPMIRAVASRHPYQVLCVSLERVALFTGDELHLRETPLHDDVPRDMAEAIGGPPRVTKQKKSFYDPADVDQRDDQLTRYFRRLDEALMRHHLDTQSPGTPLILAALPEYHTFYRESSHYPHLLDVGIKRDPFKEMPHEKLVQEAAKTYRPIVDEQVRELLDRYGEAASHGHGSDDLDEVGRQAVFGKVETLMLNIDHRVGGRLDQGTGEITPGDLSDPAVDDVTDDIAETVLRNSGRVHVVDTSDMPTRSGIAAIYRYQS